MGDERFRDGKHTGPDSTSPYPVSRLGAVIDLVDVAREIQRADAVIGTVTADKLGLIAEQIRSLQDEARRVLERAQRDAALHRADCNFEKVAGQTYHLYRRAVGGVTREYFSLLSPEDWRGAPPDEFVGSFRVEADHSFASVDEVKSRDEMAVKTKKLLHGG